MTDHMNQPRQPEQPKSRIVEELEVAGNQLKDRVTELIEQGNIRRLIIRSQEGRTLLEIPLTVGAVAGGALLFFNPLLTGLAAIGAMVARLKIEIVREEPEGSSDDADKAAPDAKRKAEDSGE